MMRTGFHRLGTAVLLCCLLCACPETTVQEDFGLKPMELRAEDWSGFWTPLDDDGRIQFTISDAAKGILRMTEPDDTERQPRRLCLRRASNDEKAGLCFALTHDDDSKEPRRPLYLLRMPDEDVILAWMTDDFAIEKAIKSGQIKGGTRRVKNEPHNLLDSVPANYTRLLEPQFWNWSEPMILKRAKP